MTEKKVLIFGIGGLGKSLVEECRKRNIPFIGTCRTAQIDLQDKNKIIRINLADKIESSFLDQHDIKYIIFTAALSNVDGCFREPLLSFRNNVLTTLNAYMFAAKRKIPFYHISTNDIFGNEKNTGIHNVHTGPVVPWTPEDIASPCGVYAVHKKTAEDQLLSLSNYTSTPISIVRLSLISFYKSGGTTFMQNILNAMKRGQPFFAMSDQWCNPIFVNTAAKTLIDLAENKIHHRFVHIAPHSWLSRLQFVQHVEKVVQKLQPNFIQPGFKIVPCVLQDLYDKKIMIDKRSQYSVLAPFPEDILTTLLEEEIEKALKWYFKGTFAG